MNVVKFIYFEKPQNFAKSPFDHYYKGQTYSGDFAKYCGVLRIYELWFYRCFKAVLKFLQFSLRKVVADI